ncbi:selenocysteine-specific translation elongation factor, partial [Enterobacter hormaechei]|uniref:selenocysteine-specific translation elongation factor n=1 Tax=Enterobacter hormaechei TaxID=158836 RepID=UPI000A62DED9
MIIATAGHVDHGKTTLLQAITGVNADRLPEEKKRGMTIDLGYAYWPQPDGRVLGFIDVPGHEKFLSNMLAGVGGIDHALLVVACDDGVMAQTREHLAILQLTGNPQLTVALTKADRVDEARIDEVRQEVLAALSEYGFKDVALFVTVATEGRGIDALRNHLQQIPSREQASHHRFRLAIDRAFTVKGAGLVVTGTALSGEVNVGDTLWLTGVNKPMRVRGLHAQNQPVEQAHAGQRIALNIAGDAEKDQLNRGDWLLADAPPEPSERIIVSLQTHTPLTQWQPLHIHHAASHCKYSGLRLPRRGGSSMTTRAPASVSRAEISRRTRRSLSASQSGESNTSSARSFSSSDTRPVMWLAAWWICSGCHWVSGVWVWRETII